MAERSPVAKPPPHIASCEALSPRMTIALTWREKAAAELAHRKDRRNCAAAGQPKESCGSQMAKNDKARNNRKCRLALNDQGLPQAGRTKLTNNFETAG
ncbi:MAG: hypothetical protein EON98_14640 [Chitinophagaceae bacterium]|nr:MAG: hypothetical protein EON98_14640 [Chitinophagaceae bacterium]